MAGYRAKIEKMKNIYLALAIIGTVLPLSQFYGFLTVYGLSFSSFFEQLLVNKVSSFFATDVFISAIATIIFIASEGRRKRIKNYWLCYIGLFFAGISCRFPLFLYLNEVSKNNTE